MTTVLHDDDVFLHGKDRDFTKAEFMAVMKLSGEAFKRGDMDEYLRLGQTLPLNANVAKAFKETYGKDFILNCGYDLTEANLRWGEGWIDEPDEEI